ncbi:hypothetical protein BX60_21820 [Escherichia coli O111:NM str. 2010C-4221]|nr:hypothetical protein ECO9574_09790 [Escherichia coli O111:H8 str. CVM9574]EYU73543.1 hypothetical protein BX60_21820 [Escherichia coli O111:NM str. 2010C-4221]EYV16344.1 hypothetical protein BX50_15230 [Escherichia coli O145:NM str. 2010C-3521]EYV32079.1 hypothetical protein BX48_14415 [Escherichia coli O145:NM str. 2010C-3517]EYV37012.1 hypothetical protein BX44_08515 [Escherichia coli O145:NM str. 2010C-3509]EYV40168.1 hypothetical protein BX45_16335 [Escherichia coli O145:NM str. 2010C-3
MPEEYVQPYSGLVECHALQDAALGVWPHQVEADVKRFFLYLTEYKMWNVEVLIPYKNFLP